MQKVKQVLERIAALEGDTSASDAPDYRLAVGCASSAARAALEELTGSSHTRVMEPLLPRTGAVGGKLVLVLDNGVRIETGGVKGPGEYILLADRRGVEIGYWNAKELASDPAPLLRLILGTAALGRPLPADVHETHVTADAWNSRYPVGTRVRYFPIRGEKHAGARETRTRSRAWTLGGGEALVKIDGQPGGVSLEHLEVLSPINET